MDSRRMLTQKGSQTIKYEKGNVETDKILPSYHSQLSTCVRKLMARKPPDLVYEAICLAASDKDLPPPPPLQKLRPRSKRLQQRAERMRAMKMPPLSPNNYPTRFHPSSLSSRMSQNSRPRRRVSRSRSPSFRPSSPDRSQNRIPNRNSYRTPNRTSNRTPIRTPNRTSNRTSNRTPNRIPNRTPNRTPNRFYNRNPNHNPGHIPNHPNRNPNRNPNDDPLHHPLHNPLRNSLHNPLHNPLHNLRNPLRNSLRIPLRDPIHNIHDPLHNPNNHPTRSTRSVDVASGRTRSHLIKSELKQPLHRRSPSSSSGSSSDANQTYSPTSNSSNSSTSREFDASPNMRPIRSPTKPVNPINPSPALNSSSDINTSSPLSGSFSKSNASRFSGANTSRFSESISPPHSGDESRNTPSQNIPSDLPMPETAGSDGNKDCDEHADMDMHDEGDMSQSSCSSNGGSPFVTKSTGPVPMNFSPAPLPPLLSLTPCMTPAMTPDLESKSFGSWSSSASKKWTSFGTNQYPVDGQAVPVRVPGVRVSPAIIPIQTSTRRSPKMSPLREGLSPLPGFGTPNSAFKSPALNSENGDPSAFPFSLPAAHDELTSKVKLERSLSGKKPNQRTMESVGILSTLKQCPVAS